MRARLVVGAALAPALLAGGLTGSVLFLPTGPSGAGCPAPVSASTPVGAAAGPVTGPTGTWDGEQVVNAAAVLAAGRALGVPDRGLVVGVMTAMGESSLRVLDRGDTAGPDSRGLFQQRANGAWGSLADRMDPTRSATAFFTALLAVPGWESLPPTIAAHRTQHNADPWHYARWWDDAVAVVTALDGRAPAGAATGTGALPCTATTPVQQAVVAGWTAPVPGPRTSGYGWRGNPTGGGRQLHAGVDLAPGCGVPVVAAAAGVVVRAGHASGFGNLVVVDHGGGVLTRYGHMTDDGVLVVVGQQVAAGQQLARVGSAGDSTGCHLHLEVWVDGAAVDPEPFLAARGVSWRA